MDFGDGMQGHKCRPCGRRFCVAVQQKRVKNCPLLVKPSPGY